MHDSLQGSYNYSYTLDYKYSINGNTDPLVVIYGRTYTHSVTDAYVLADYISEGSVSISTCN